MSLIPAEVKKKENIAEYIIHMYQTEDLILSYDFKLDEIFEYVIKHMSRDQQVLKELLLWYADIIDQMKSEKVKNNKKRLRSTQKYIEQISLLHEHLLVDDEDYKKIYANAKIDIEQNIALSEGRVKNPMQICINGIYGMLLLKLNGKKISVEQKTMLEHFGAVLAYLSLLYKSTN